MGNKFDLDFNGVEIGQSVNANNYHIFNYYWSSNWDMVNGNPLMKQIDLATQVVIAAGYFRRACQYGTPSVFWKGSGNSNNFFGGGCGGQDPPGRMPLSTLFHFFACQEGTGQAGVPALGAPNLFTCGGCDLTGGFDCFLDAACVATPNPSGDTIYNLFLPADTILDELPPSGGGTAFHFQIPSNRVAALPGLPGTGLPTTSGRPLYVAIIPVANNPTFDQLVATITHEDIEAATDPFPGASWINNADTQAHPGHGEVADICQDHRSSTALFQFMPAAKIGALDTSGLPKDMMGKVLPLTVSRYWSNNDHECLPPFITPTTTAAILPPPNAKGWHRALDVAVTLTAAEPGGIGGLTVTSSAMGAQPIPTSTSASPSATLHVAAEGVTVVSYFARDSAANTEAPTNTLTVKIDRTPPTVAEVARNPLPNQFGWNNTPVTVTFACSDALSGVSSCEDQKVAGIEQRNQVVVASATDNADNVGAGGATGISIDLTPPAIVFEGNAGTYTIDQTVNITCTAVDLLSGVYLDTCRDIQAPAFQFFPKGTLAAMAVDRAGNSSAATTSFTVQVTFSSLANLTRSFACSSGIGNSLAVKIEHAATARDPKTRDNHLNSFINDVNAQAGKCLFQAHADLLATFAVKLM